MRCPNCGKNIPDNSRSCPGCKTQFQVKSVKSTALSGSQLGRLLYIGLFVCAILITVFIYLKWQSTGIGESYSLAKMTEMYTPETDAASWFTNATYIVLCLQLLAMVMWIVTYAKPSSVIPLLAGGVTFLGAFVFLIMAIFGIGPAFVKIENFTRTATIIPYLTLLFSAAEFACALYSPALLKSAAVETVKSAQQGNTKKLIDELNESVVRDTAAKSEPKGGKK